MLKSGVTLKHKKKREEKKNPCPGHLPNQLNMHMSWG